MTADDQKPIAQGSLVAETTDLVGRLRHARVHLDASSPTTAHGILEPLFAENGFAFPSASLRMEALALYVRSCVALGHSDHVRRNLLELRQLFQTTYDADPEARARAAAVIAHMEYVSGRYDSAIQLCSSIRATDIMTCSSHAAFSILAVKQAALSRRGRLEEAGDVCGVALDLAERIGDIAMQGNVLSWLANLSRLRGLMEASLRMYSETAQLYRRAGYSTGLARVHHNRGNVLHRLGSVREALQCYREAGKLARQCSDSLLLLRTLIGQGMTGVRLGDFATARRQLLHAWREARRLGAAREVCLCAEFLGELQILTGRTAAARRTLRLGRRLAHRLAPEGDLVAELGVREAFLALTEGSWGEAGSRARESIDLCVRQGMVWEEAQARRLVGAALAGQGEVAGARGEIARARDLYERMGERLEIRLALAWLAWLGGDRMGEPPPLHPSALEPLPEQDLGESEGEAESYEESPREALRRVRESAGERVREASPEEETVGGPAAAPRRGGGRPTSGTLHPIWESLGLVTRTGRMIRLLEELQALAESGANILVVGETGTGKELVARGAHRLSRRGGRFVPFNCAGCPVGLVASELFGVERGAYTGADRRRAGLIQRAAGGTLFLDEVGDLRVESQGALLRFLDSGEVRCLGSKEIHSVRLGVVAATLRPLDQMLQEQSFRADLYYRLAQGYVQLPPLRERLDDLELLLAALWSRLHGGTAPAWLFEAPAQEVLRAHSWKGNIRELGHLLQRLRVRAGTSEVPPDILAVLLREGTQLYGPSLPSPERIAEALKIVDGNRSRAAALLGISRAKLYRLIEKSGRPCPSGWPARSA